MRTVKQSTAYDLAVFMTDASDHVSGKTGLTLTITASKAGAAFSSISPTVTELSNGWYKVALTTSHTDTLGDLALHVTATGADPTDLLMQVRANVLGDTLPANVTQFGGSNGAFSGGRPEVNTTHLAGTSQTGRDIGASVLVGDKTGFSLSSAGVQAIWDALTSALTTVGSIGKRLVDNIDAAISSRLAGASYAAPLDAAGVRSAVGLASANLDTQLGAIDTKTTNLPSDPADQSLVIAATDAILTRLGAPAGVSVSADVAAVKAQTTAIEADTQDLQTQVGSAGAGLTGVPWNAAWDAEVQSEVQDAIEANHLDHLLAATYDPASKPGAADALFNELVESDAGVSRFTANALEQAPTGGSAPTAAAIADAVWEEAIADHSATPGSVAEALNAAGSAGDPWTTALPGSYTGSQAGKMLADVLADTGTTLDGKLDAVKAKTDGLPADPADASDVAASFSSVASTLATIASYIDTEIAAIKAKTDALPMDPADQSQVDASIAAAQSALAAAIAALNNLSAAQVKAQADQALADVGLTLVVTGRVDAAVSSRLAGASYAAPLDAAGVRAAIGLALANLDTQLAAIDDLIDTEAAAIKAKTDLIPAAPAAVGDVPTAAQNAAALMDLSNGVESGLTPRQALRLMVAALAGKISGAATTTIVIRNAVADTKPRITATVDADGNRSAVATDLN